MSSYFSNYSNDKIVKSSIWNPKKLFRNETDSSVFYVHLIPSLCELIIIYLSTKP